MTDKLRELSASVVLVNNRLHFRGTSGNNTPVSIDYIPPLGDNLGYTSLELLLLSLSSCLGSAMLPFLRRMNKSITSFEIKADGLRKEDHPTAFSIITLEIFITSPDVAPEDLDKVISLAEQTYCPVWAMLKGNVELRVIYSVNKGA